jgi:prepilin-type N-terminal cleavage/methylation domain-containing protein
MPSLFQSQKHATGFTLAELLIALAILGVIAAFTIPKLILVQQGEQHNAIAKEAIAMVGQSFSYMQANNQISSATTPGDLFQYMNYVNIDTSTVIDNTYTNATTMACSVANPCLRLHNGAILFSASNGFGGTATTNIIWYNLDPDGYATSAGTTDGPGKSFKFGIYYNGRISSRDEILPGSKNGTTTYNPASPPVNPPWFHW